MPELAWSRYGKSRVRLVKLKRSRDPHDIVDLTLDVQLEGDFDRVFTNGDNSACLATDTMKNTVYAFARQDPIDYVEAFAVRLADHFASKPSVERVRIGAAEQRWERLAVGGRPHPHAFVQAGSEQWTTVVTKDPRGIEVRAGITSLVVLKTTDSAFAGFPRDRFTTLPETADRILATSVTAEWKYASAAVDFETRHAIRKALVETFAAHQSRSVQHTMYAMGEAALAACRDIAEITLVLPNRHHLQVDLAPFDLDNPNEVFVATDQPFGLIEATIRRTLE